MARFKGRAFVALLIYYTTGVDACAPMSGVDISQKLTLMKKAKKQTDKQMLTREELLSRALVPENEQPYKIPENWVWVKFYTLAKEIADGPFGSNLKQVHYTTKKEVRIIQLSNIGEEGWREDNKKYTSFEHAKTIARSIVNSGNIVIAKMMPAGRAIIVPNHEKMFILSSDAIKFTPCNIVDTKYLVNGINSIFFLNQIRENTQGITRARTSIGKLKNYVFPLPPLAEQQRIVERIENLFEKLDRAKELAQSAIDSFEARKAAIMHKAFTGELTAKWREENGIDLESWKTKFFTDVAIIKTNLVDPKNYPDFPHIAPDSIEKRTGVLLKYNTIREDGMASGKHRFYPGQILYTKIRPYLSKIVIIDFDGLCSADMYPIEAKENNRYLWHYMLSENFLEQASNAGSRSVLPKINQKELSTLSVRIPTLPEQHEIVRILDSMLDKEKRARELYDVIEKIDLMKKAILARAFRGKLGTNDPADMGAQASRRSCNK